MVHYKLHILYPIKFSIRIFNSFLFNFGLLHNSIVKPFIIIFVREIYSNMRLINIFFDTMIHNYYNSDIFSKNSKHLLLAAGRFANKHIFFSSC